MASPGAGASSKQKPVSASVEPCSPVPSPSVHTHLLSKATVIICTREDLHFHLTTPPTRHDPAPRPIPTVGRAANPSSESPQANAEDDDNTDDAMSDTASFHSPLTSTSNKIPKPNGEVGRPGRGGYNLGSQLAWDSTRFRRLKKCVHHSMKKHLDTTKCRSSQNTAAIRLVVLEVLDVFPELEDYAAYWPIQDLIQMRLKYTSMRAGLAQRMKAGNMQENKGRSVSPTTSC